MVSARKLSGLRELQKLREEQRKLGLVDAIDASREAQDALNTTAKLLDDANTRLDRALSNDVLDLDRFQILAGHINALDDQYRSDQVQRDEASDAESDARTEWQKAERQTHNLNELHKSQSRREQRRAEDESAREFLSALAARKGAAQ